MRRIRVRWARVLIVVLAGVASAVGCENAALREDLESARLAARWVQIRSRMSPSPDEVEARSVLPALPRPITGVEVNGGSTPLTDLAGWRVVEFRIIAGTPTLELECSHGPAVPLAPAIGSSDGQWEIVGYELSTPVSSLTLEWRAAHVQVVPVRDLLARGCCPIDPSGFEHDRCSFSSEAHEAHLDLRPEQLVAALRAMTRDPGPLEVRGEELAVRRTAEGHARIRHALAALRKAAVEVEEHAPEEGDLELLAAVDLRMEDRALQIVLRAMTARWAETAHRVHRGQIIARGTPEQRARTRFCLAALRAAAAGP